MPGIVDAVVTDLDGTMWATDMSVHAETLRAIERIDEAGIPLLIATGRRARSALVGLSRAGLAARPGVLMNGALARDRLDGPSFLTASISPDDAQQTVDAFRSNGLEPLVYVDHPDADMVVGPAPAAGRRYIDSAPGVAQVEDLDEAVASSVVIGFGAFGFSLGQLEPIASAINDAGWATAILAESLFEGDHGLMIQGAGIDKITAIDAWCSRHGVDVDNIAVLGDGANDLGMLDAARLAIVPSSAPAAIREHATHIIEPAESGGWAQLPAMLDLD